MIGEILGGLGGLVGGLIGNYAASDERDAAKADQKKALEAILGVTTPTLRDVNLAKYGVTDIYDPSQEQAIQLGPSQMAGVTVDPAYKAVQMEALNELKAKIDAGGLSAADRAALNEANRAVATNTRGKEAAIMENLAARGMGGGGGELAARMANAQAGNMAAAAAADRQAAMAEQAKREAMAQMSQQASGMSTQDFNQAAAKANAADLFAKFNAEQSAGVQQRNVGSDNTAKQMGFTERSQVGRLNTDVAHRQEMQNKIANPQSQYNMASGHANSVATAYGNQAAAANADADRTAAMWSGAGSAAGKTAATALMPPIADGNSLESFLKKKA